MDERVEKWLAKALNDLRAAEQLLKAPAPRIVAEAVCFHAQQAVEKLIKAFLTFHEIPFGKTHHLEYLINLASKVEPSFLDLMEDVSKLTPYAVEVRYPDDFYTPTLEEAEEAYKIALSVRDFVRKKLGME